jgi:hypothetical protein
MKSWHWNGEFWYSRDWSLLKRLRVWLIWLGGWEQANSSGWKLFGKNVGEPHYHWIDPRPISLFGHRITFFRKWIDVKLPGCYMRIKKKYISLDHGTPNTTFAYFGEAPKHIKRQAEFGASVNDN